MNRTAAQWQQRLKQPLPGREAHRQMAPPGRPLDIPPPDSARQSAVLILMSRYETPENILFIRRTQDGQVHGGQIGFPGGRVEEQDADLTDTALRECEEEIGLKREAIEVLGQLSSLYIPPSGFLVTPVLASWHQEFALTPSPREVAEILSIPIDVFHNPATRCVKNMYSSSRQAMLEAVPVYSVSASVDIWGATAMMLAELLWLMQEAKP